MPVIYGFAGSLIIAGAAYWKRSLSLSGLIAAVLLGTTMYALGSLAWFGTLIAFFISSSLLSKLKHQRKAAAESGYAKGGRRDAGQVAANGGLGLLLCMGNAIWPSPLWWLLFIGVMATVTADTWATEIGGMSKSIPRSIVTGKRVTAGTSGGITGLGLLASILGGAFIGLIGGLLNQLGEPQAVNSSMVLLILLGSLAGLGGSLVDSWLGATLQVMFHCEVCGKTIEKQEHCHQKARQIRGLQGMSNDAVNASSSFIGGGICLVLYMVFALL
ncbi:DUF92 domain-containing protein [Paenibacillus qinlingensis]|uniref:Uncharacterized protein (TIGR00297 family) n=1 Tax=Paenibacillus qinlingensis TaxID=1837343 RepID=A0ABU1NPD4_9BACL|nr:DUF92 domain-containing protein [Paenibacillus qinlingensis]MDR6548886.1 uncharacterized protein (TIGR00297 family) [Paenibacillus qinlingensis]